MSDLYAAARRDVWLHARRMWEAGLVVASAGNVSCRVDGRLAAITPTSIPYDVMTEDEVVVVDIETGGVIDGARAPSYEAPMHLAVYRARPEVHGVVHTHAPFVTTLSVLRKPLPPIIDEMMMYFGGTVEVADYAFTGTTELGANVVRALGERSGVIMANHGNVCVGRSLDQAMHIAITMESTARVYVQALSIGTPIPLPEPAVDGGRRMFDERRWVWRRES